MAIKIINIGSSANKGDGDPLRTAFKKINENFAELDTLNTVRDIKGSVFGDDSTLLVDGTNSLIPSSVLSGSLPAIDGSALTGITATTFGGQNASYYLDFTNFTNTPTTIVGYGITDAFDGVFSSLTSKPTTLSGYGITDAYTKTEVDSAISSSVLTSGSTHSIDIVSSDSTLLVDSVNGTLNATTLTGALPAIDGSALTGITATTLGGQNASYYLDYNNFTNTPALITNNNQLTNGEGYITASSTDTLTNKSGNISMFTNDANYLTSVPAQAFVSLSDTPANFTGQAGKFVKVNAGESGLEFDTVSGGAETDPIVGAITGIVKSDGAGNISAAVAGTDYSTFDGDYGSLSNQPTLFSGVFADLTSKPTTIGGYGITDAFDGAFGSLTGTPTTLSGYGITDALASVSTSSQTLDVSGAGLGISIGNASTSGSTVSIGAEVNNTSVNMNGVTEFNARAIFSRGTHEIFYTFNGQGGVTDHNVMLGHLFYHTGVTGDLTPNFTNFDLTAEDATNITIIIQQGNTEYEIPAIQIDGAAQTIVWQNNSAPTGTANGTDSFSFTILNDGGTYVVLGQMVSFGGV